MSEYNPILDLAKRQEQWHQDRLNEIQRNHQTLMRFVWLGIAIALVWPTIAFYLVGQIK
jgi:hypothetical protein